MGSAFDEETRNMPLVEWRERYSLSLCDPDKPIVFDNDSLFPLSSVDFREEVCESLSLLLYGERVSR